MSKTIVCPFGETSREIQLASSVVKFSFRGVASGSEFVRVAARAAESFWAVVCARAGSAVARRRAATVRTWGFIGYLRGRAVWTCLLYRCANPGARLAGPISPGPSVRCEPEGPEPAVLLRDRFGSLGVERRERDAI